MKQKPANSSRRGFLKKSAVGGAAAAAQVAYNQGKFRAGLEMWTDLYDRASTRGDDLQRAWGLNGRSEALLKRGGEGHADQAVELLEVALDIFDRNVDRVSKFGTYGLLALAHSRRGDDLAARHAADAGMDLADELGAPTGYYSLNGYANIAKTFLSLWDSSRSAGDSALRKMAERDAWCVFGVNNVINEIEVRP